MHTPDDPNDDLTRDWWRAVSGQAHQNSLDFQVQPFNERHTQAELVDLMHLVTDGAATYTDEIQFVLGIHGPTECVNCWIHRPSPHALAYAPVAYRDRRFLRVCPHRTGHYDVDENAFYRREYPDDPIDTDCACECRCCEGPLLPPPAGGVYEMPADATGLWEISTSASVHVLDLDASTWTRYAQPAAHRTSIDGVRQPLAALGTLPRVNRRTLLWRCDDTDHEWVLTSPVERIQRIDFDFR